MNKKKSMSYKLKKLKINLIFKSINTKTKLKN